MNKEEIEQMIKDNLRLSIDEETQGFNGRCTVVRLYYGDVKLSEEYIEIDRDTG